MAKTESAGMSQETKEMLDEVKKGKVRKAILIYKGSTIQDFIVFKKGPYNTRVLAAKKAGARGVAVCGLLTGSGEKLSFQIPGTSAVAKEMKVTDTFDGDPVKTQKLKTFLADNALKRKPEFDVVKDPALVAGVSDGEEGSENDATPPLENAGGGAVPPVAPPPENAAGGAVPPPAAAADGEGSADIPAEMLKKAEAAWVKTLAAVDKEIKKLQTAIIKEFRNSDEGKKLAGSVKQLDGVLNQIDTKLSDKLKEAASASDAAQSEASRNEAVGIIADYKQLLKKDPLLKGIDKNPFVGVSINKTLESTLSVLEAKIKI